jgi:hypothetical protein
MSTDQPTFLTDPTKFTDVSRGNPIPHTLTGEALVNARLTPDSWRLEITADDSTTLEKPRQSSDNSAIDLITLKSLAPQNEVHFLKALQCNNIQQPLGQGLWQGIPLASVLHLAGEAKNVRRIFYSGFHNNDPNQLFQSSLSYNQVFDSPPGELPPFIAYALNGDQIPLVRGGPVRLIVPWAHGFKSIKWLNKITLTNDFEANDTYAGANNDPESFLKTAAYIDNRSEEARAFPANIPITINGTAIVGWPGLQRVEFWLRPESGTHGRLPKNDPAWALANWSPCELEPLPTNWTSNLPNQIPPQSIHGFDKSTGNPLHWPIRFSIVRWTATLPPLQPGGYEFRARSIDKNGLAQPLPRPNPQSGQNQIQCQQIIITQ